MSANNFQQLTDTSMALAAADSLSDSLKAAQAGKRPFRFRDVESENDSVAVGMEGQVLVPLEGPGLFKGHSLSPKHPSAEPINSFASDWFTLSLLVLVGIFTWFRVFYYRIFKQLISAFFNVTATNQIVRDESVLLQRASLIISIIAYLLAGLFLYQTSIHYSWDIDWLPKGLVRFAMFAVAIATAYSLKMIALRFLSALFSMEKAVALYIFNIFLMVMMAALILLPANIAIAYAEPYFRSIFIQLTIALMGILFLYRLLRAFGIWTGIPGFSIFYLFLYLCTFEIAPLLIIWKLATA